MKLEFLAKDTIFVASWPSYEQDLTDSPEDILGLFGLAIHHSILAELPPVDDTDDLSTIYSNLRFNTKMINVRIMDFLPIMKIDSFLKDGHGKLVTVRGTILKIETSKLVCKWMAFKCVLCASLMMVKQNEPREMTSPSRCAQGCKATSNFICMRSSPYTRVVSSQLIHLGEFLNYN